MSKYDELFFLNCSINVVGNIDYKWWKENYFENWIKLVLKNCWICGV